MDAIKLDPPLFLATTTYSGAEKIARAAFSGIVSGTATALARGGKVEITQVATDAFGNALGNSIADEMKGGAQGEDKLREALSKPSTTAMSEEDYWNTPAPTVANRYQEVYGGEVEFARARATTVGGGRGQSTMTLGPAMVDEDAVGASGQGSAMDNAGAQSYPVRSPEIEARPLPPMGNYSMDATTLTTQVADNNSYNLGERFVRGAVHGAVDMVWQPVAQVLDLGQAAYGMAYSLTTGGLYEPDWFSGIGQNYAAGMSSDEIVTRAVLGATPITGVGLAAYDLTSSAVQGDWGRVAEGAGGLVGGFAAAKYGQRAFAPEPGAQLGVYRVRPEIEVPDPLVSPGNLLKPLPADQAPNFVNAQPTFIGGKPLYRVFDNVDAYANGRWWADKPIPAAEGQWRSGYAVTEQYNAGTNQARYTPSGEWAWGGKAAPQGVKGSYREFDFMGSTYRYGWIQPGGQYQIFIGNARNSIPSSALVTGPTPWNR